MRLKREIIPISAKKIIKSSEPVFNRMMGASLSYGKRAIGVYAHGCFQGNLYFDGSILVPSVKLKRSDIGAFPFTEVLLGVYL